jgi:hypothetical protein
MLLMSASTRTFRTPPEGSDELIAEVIRKRGARRRSSGAAAHPESRPRGPRTLPRRGRIRINSPSDSAGPPTTITMSRPWGIADRPRRQPNDLTLAPALAMSACASSSCS